MKRRKEYRGMKTTGTPFNFFGMDSVFISDTVFAPVSLIMQNKAGAASGQ